MNTKKFNLAVEDFNKLINIKLKFYDYFDELDKYKKSEENNLKEVEIKKIKEMGFDEYCIDIVNKYQKYSDKLDVVCYYLKKEHNFIFEDEMFEKGILIKN